MFNLKKIRQMKTVNALQKFNALSKKVACILLLLLFTGTLSAQKEKTAPTGFYVPKHEIGVSYGFFPTPIFIPMFHIFCPDINFDYYYNINSRHAVGATLSLFFDYPDFGMIIAPQINYRISYCQRNVNDFYFNFYSLASIGWKIPIASGKEIALLLFPTVHVTVLGMRVGNRRNAATIEFGYGTHGFVAVGYTHSFIRKK
jgi:hypothetical protein